MRRIVRSDISLRPENARGSLSGMYQWAPEELEVGIIYRCGEREEGTEADAFALSVFWRQLRSRCGNRDFWWSSLMKSLFSSNISRFVPSVAFQISPSNLMQFITNSTLSFSCPCGLRNPNHFDSTYHVYNLHFVDDFQFVVRILFMVPLYSIEAWFSLFFNG